jgi:hypothetical protein
VPIEKLQNLLVYHHPDLYAHVVRGRSPRNAFRAFLRGRPDVFELSPDDREDAEHLRVHLLLHFSWRAGDAREAAERERRSAALLHTLCAYLALRPDHTAAIDEFIVDYNCGDRPAPLPRRGDLVRFIKSNPHALRWNRRSLTVSLVDPPSAAV